MLQRRRANHSDPINTFCHRISLIEFILFKIVLFAAAIYGLWTFAQQEVPWLQNRPIPARHISSAKTSPSSIAPPFPPAGLGLTVTAADQAEAKARVLVTLVNEASSPAPP
jgi:hypothetical protein